MNIRAHHAIPIVLLYGLGYPLGALALGELSPPWVLLVRFIAAGAILAVVALIARAPWPRGTQLGHALVVGILTHAVQFGFAYEGMALGVAPTLTALVIAMNPVATAVIAALSLRERPSTRGLIGIGLGVIAVCIAFAGRVSLHGIDPAIVFTLLALLGTAGAGVYQQRFMPGAEPLPLGAIGQFASAIPIAIWACFVPPELGDPLRATLALSAMVVLSAATGTTVYAAAIKASGAARVSLLFAVIPSSAALFAWLLLGQAPTVGVIIALVLGGVACVIGTGGRQQPPSAKARAHRA